ncbi:MAG: hypothetical protein QW677_09040 [Pyrobaculum sp.]|uniref:Uncharacterized protein n=2 Tax=Pyrobaculum arsenaticum TaxID=121277 RepID=A4WK79_PYRAR|nr:hypothetical protein [Pyrobaculum arsenaticum]ABP50796.1 conserved hypothetical protein [Pyrobaculum arsenaticum DSM 13514]MCY0891211.1 hypothetical protein [Pyrobaculum arsenaticum]NYR15486.1 hypothetical protein [Pyrobaculum arsenaticum]
MLNLPSLDHSAHEILSYIAIKGPVTMYRVARDLSYHFSHTYRKAYKLEKLGLIKKVDNGRAALYEATLGGYVYCYLAGIEPRKVVVSKISKMLGLDHFSVEEVESFLKLYISAADHYAPLGGFVTMVSYLLERCGWEVERCAKLGEKELILATRVISYGIISLIRRFYAQSLIITGRDYFVVYDVEKMRLLAAHCRLCGRDKYCSLDPCPTLRNEVEPRLKVIIQRGVARVGNWATND